MSILNLAATIFSIYFFLTVIMAHLLKRECILKRDSLSRYAIGKWGFMVTSGFIFIGLSQVIISWGFFNMGNIIPAILIFISAIGVWIVGLFRISEKRCLLLIHETGATIYFLFFSLALLYFSLFLSKNIFTLVIGGLTLILLLGMKWSYPDRYKKNSKFARIQKINILFINIWLILFPIIGL
jgi:hypothetical protein